MGARRLLTVPACLLVLAAAACGSSTGPAPSSAPPSTSSSATSAPATSSTVPSTAAPAASSAASTHRAAPRTRPATSAAAPRPASRTTSSHPAPPTTAAPRGSALPLALPTGDATRVVTVTAPGTGSTSGTLQAWQRDAGGWTKVGPAVGAWFGSAGLSRTPSESQSATPIGSFTLTRAFGRLANPGTALPYRQTTPADWWISQSGPLYNTLQHCTGSCPFTQGDPNEHLYYETPYYDHAVVIDYNTANSPTGVRQGAGSAFFLHVSVGSPTAGCVAIPAGALTTLMRWLTPAAHPRILIGVA